MRLINLRDIVKYFSLGIVTSSILHLSVAAEVEQANATHQSSTNYEWVTKRTAWLIGRFEGWFPNVYMCPAHIQRLDMGI